VSPWEANGACVVRSEDLQTAACGVTATLEKARGEVASRAAAPGYPQSSWRRGVQCSGFPRLGPYHIVVSLPRKSLVV